MGRRLLLINAVMLVGIYLLARHVTASWHEYSAENNVDKVVKRVPAPKQPPIVESPAPPSAPLPENEFTQIPDKDLFSPERRPPPPPDPVKDDPPPKLAKNPSLNGILNNQGRKQALLTVFDSNSQQQKGRSMTVSVGDTVQGYTVIDISDTTMTLRYKEKEDSDIVVDMFDATPEPKGPAERVQRIATATIVTIGSAAPAVDAGNESPTPGGETVASAQPGAAQPVAVRPPGVKIQSPGLPRSGTEGGAVNPNRPGVVGAPGSVPFTSRTRREN